MVSNNKQLTFKHLDRFELRRMAQLIREATERVRLIRKGTKNG